MPLRRLSDSKNEAIGALHQWIRLERPGSRNADGGGQPPAPFYEGWAEVRAPGRGSELDKITQIAQIVEHIIRMPFRNGVTEDMLVIFDQRTLQIHYIEDQDERKFWLYLYVAEIGQNAGGKP